MLEDLDGIRSSPAIGPDGTVYAAGHYHVYAVDPQGELRWAYETPERAFAFSSPAVASDGTIYVGGADGRLYAINPDGSPRWTFAAGDIIHSSPAIGRNGTIYFQTISLDFHGGRFYAVDPDGFERWSVPHGGQGTSSSPSIGPDGTIYVGAGWGSGGFGVVAIDSGGSVRWSSRPSTYDTPILGADGTVYVTATGSSGERVIAALDSQGRLQWDYQIPGDFQAAPAIGVEGAILAVSLDPVVLYAIVENDGANGGYAGAPWPQARGNRANNGRAGG
jgi:outer membrane protein assembly factor BamB